jgi:hypothetical protein
LSGIPEKIGSICFSRRPTYTGGADSIGADNYGAAFLQNPSNRAPELPPGQEFCDMDCESDFEMEQAAPARAGRDRGWRVLRGTLIAPRRDPHTF